MIPESILLDWREYAPWSQMIHVEQDLVLTRAVIELYSDPAFADAFAFRGGTAMQKLFYDPPVRYSEDIDLVQVRREPIGPAIDTIRKHLDPWLGQPKRDFKENRVTLYYRFTSEIAPVQPMRLKIEVNNGEHFTVLPLQRRKMMANSAWFSGTAEPLTYSVEELLGTKLRALYQRRKGRDLFDLAMALRNFPKLSAEKTIECFQRYMTHVGSNVTRALFEENMAAKLENEAFTGDIVPLLATDAPEFDVRAAHDAVAAAFISRLPGDPWRRPEKKEKKKKPKE